MINKGYTRMPVCCGSQRESKHYGTKFRGIMGVKRLLGYDGSKKFTIEELVKVHPHMVSEITYVAKDTNLLTMFRIFQMSKTSMVAVVDQTKDGYLKSEDKQEKEFKRQKTKTEHMNKGKEE